MKRLFLFHYVTVLLILTKTSPILRNIPNIMIKFSEKLLDSIPSLKKETFQVLTIGKYLPINIFDCEKKTNKFENWVFLWPVKSCFQVLVSQTQASKNLVTSSKHSLDKTAAQALLRKICRNSGFSDPFFRVMKKFAISYFNGNFRIRKNPNSGIFYAMYVLTWKYL